MRDHFAIRVLAFAVAMFMLPSVHAAQVDMHGPTGSVSFGKSVAVLPNGNFVVVDPDGPISGIGAVYLHSPDGTLISTLTGTVANDNVGSGGITVVGNNFVVSSPSWHNGSVASAGAVTWVNGITGHVYGSSSANNVVSSANSLVGTHANDAVGIGSITALNDGNYVVPSYGWNNFVGAVTWGKSDGSIVGAVSVANSLTGSTSQDQV